MGFFNKIVNLLSDPVEEEEEIVETKTPKKEEKKSSEPVVKREVPREVKKEVEKPIYDVSKDKELTKKEPERGLYQSKDTFKFPVFNDDEIDETLSKSRVEKSRVTEKRSEVSKSTPAFEKPSVIASKLEKKEPAPVVEEKKIFRPSPVISPVYGVLEKNYNKEDIVDKNEEIKSSQTRVDISNTSAISYDVVRRKAYGTLEDELEDTLSGRFKRNEEVNKVNEVKKDIKELENPKKHIEKLLDELEKTASMTVGEIEEALKEELDDTVKFELPDTLINGLDTTSKSNVEEELEKTEEFKPKDIKIEQKNDEELENDLFNLIDSMYEEREE